uniref:Uncharacterized protein n=1 Tax=Steinernema glaseri TaxID=37863 RepID=A0A1I7Z8H4_9BILA
MISAKRGHLDAHISCLHRHPEKERRSTPLPRDRVDRASSLQRFHGVAVSTQDSESCDPSSNLGGTFLFLI